MHISALVAQFPISFSVQDNLAAMVHDLERALPGDWVVFPEGALSGYDNDLSFLDKIDHARLQAGLDHLGIEAQKRAIHLWVGTCIREKGHWYNTAYGFEPNGKSHVYRKVNLATHERGVFTAGSDLHVFRVETPAGRVSVGVQICRDLRFPEQWGWLARCGAQIILHLNNAVGNAQARPVWRSHLVSRAAETQRFVLSANNAASDQTSPTLAVAPDGHVLGEIVSGGASILRLDLDLTLVSDWYLGQCRTDVVAISSQ